MRNKVHYEAGSDLKAPGSTTTFMRESGGCWRYCSEFGFEVEDRSTDPFGSGRGFGSGPGYGWGEYNGYGSGRGYRMRNGYGSLDGRGSGSGVMCGGGFEDGHGDG